MFGLAAMIPVALLSVPHCAAMCGPLSACATRCDRRRQLGYQIGRLLTYSVAGAAAGGVGRGLGEWIGAPWVTASATWLVALALFGAAISTLVGPRRSTEPVAIGRRRTWLSRTPAPLFGALTVFLPCGALWAALAIATSTRSVAGGAAAMVVFALITGLAVTAAAAICARLRRARWLFSAALITGAVLLAIAPAGQLASSEPQPSCPLHSSP